jgi:1-acyl-sn-glycerol-3-phosphate acyltransferase
MTVISGTLSILIGWWGPGYYFISRFFWSPALLVIANIRVTRQISKELKDLPPCIFFANHRSHFDIPVMMYSLPRPLYFMAKKELKSVPFLGWGMAAIGMIFIDRRDRTAAIQSMQRAGNQIKAGKSVSTFPEGTRSETSGIQNFKKGAFHLAKSQGIPLVPVAISGTEKVLPKHGKLRSGRVIIETGAPITVAEMEDRSVEDLRILAEKKIAELLESQQTKNKLHKFAKN